MIMEYKKFIKLSGCFIFCFLISNALSSQTMPADSSSLFDFREFNQHKLDSFRNHPDFQYEDAKPETLELTWFQRQWIKLLRLLAQNPDQTLTGWNIFVYIIATLAVVAIILGIYKIGVKDIFARKSKALMDDFVEVAGDIQAVDFESLIAEARKSKTYKIGVRLLYLETLKTLTTQNLINWQRNKTNQEYLSELKGSRFQQEFEDLTLSYEYVCYGDWGIDLRGFNRMEKIFRTFQQKVAQNEK